MFFGGEGGGGVAHAVRRMWCGVVCAARHVPCAACCVLRLACCALCTVCRVRASVLCPPSHQLRGAHRGKCLRPEAQHQQMCVDAPQVWCMAKKVMRAQSSRQTAATEARARTATEGGEPLKEPT